MSRARVRRRTKSEDLPSIQQALLAARERGELVPVTTQQAKALQAMTILDAVLGTPWWVFLIDLRSFDIRYGGQCVIGQVFDGPAQGTIFGDGWTEGMPALEGLFDGMNHGLADLLHEIQWEAPFDGGTVRNRTWKRVLRQRQVELAGSPQLADKVREAWVAQQQEAAR